MRFEQIPIDLIIRNEDNPRGIDIPADDPKLSLLKESIDQFGILVPLVVTPRGAKYELLDGERRYWAARSLKLSRVPAYITQGRLDEDEILLRMFHIHHNRENWGPIPQCKALERLYRRFASSKKSKNFTDEEERVRFLASELCESTGIEERTARHRVLFLRWPSDVKEYLYSHPNDDYWYIAEIEDNIILPAMKNYPEYFDKVPVDDVRRFLYEKLKSGSVAKATEPRALAQVLSYTPRDAADKKKVLRIVDELVKDKSVTYQDARDEFYRAFPDALKIESPSPRRLLSTLSHAKDQVYAFDPATFATSKKKAKAKREQVVEAATDLVTALKDLCIGLEKQI